MKWPMAFLICLGFSLVSEVNALTPNDLKAGDVLLLSLDCFECRIIESETESAFSHSGVVLIDENGRTRVAQSLGKLDHFSLTDFSQRMTKGTRLNVYRPKEFISLTGNESEKLNKSMRDIFNEKFKGAPFDEKFLWSNVDKNGRELLYCSEFIAKFLDYFLMKKTTPLPISYKKHYDYWWQYFKGEVPDGELGNSPAAFSRDARFEFIGTL